MCGIVGALTFENSNFQVNEKFINLMRDAMIHRGPDGAGTWISQDKKVGLGHRRLSIVDLSSAADQPMCNEDGSLWIVFNGEIYNHMDIRAELNVVGNHKWKTHHSDTEMILHSFEQWGIDCVIKFRGMFSFAIWDRKKRDLWLVRDRIGIKPLYYSIHNERIVFASEIKAILKDPEQKREVNEDAFYNYLSFLTTPAPQTLFEGIKKLKPGTWLKVKENGNLEEYKYWDVLDNVEIMKDLSEDEIANKVLEELRTSVNLRKMSDVPVGVFLSGGIDSSTNAALFSEGEQNKVKAFTIGYDGEYKTYKNETDYAKLIAEKVDVEYHEKLLNIDDLIDFLPQMAFLQDEPIADVVCVPVYYVSKLARDNGVTVCQVGEGADELFCGYKQWITILNLEKLNKKQVPLFLKRNILKILKIVGKENSFYYELLRRAVNKQPIFWGGAEAFTETQKKKIISKRLREKYNNYTSWEIIKPIYDNFKNKAYEPSFLNWMTYLDLSFRLPELLLMRVDKMSMGVSLEGRVPFLDHKFVELAMSIPSNIKAKDNISKYILKKAVRGLIPDEIIDRKKQGFGVPIYEWFFDKLGDKTRILIEEFCNQTDFLDKNEVMKLINEGNSAKVWFLLNFVLWWKEYIQ